MFSWYPQYEYYLACVQLVCFMLGMGAKLSPEEFLSVFRRPRSLLFGLTYQIGIVPLIALAINSVSSLEPGIAVGLVLIALMPGGSISKVFTHLGRGNVALCITLSVCSTLATIVTVPLLLPALAAGAVPEGFRMPAEKVVAEVGLFLLLPIGVGMLAARAAPNQRRVITRSCVFLGWAIVIVMVTGALGSGRIQPGKYGWEGPAAIIVFCLAAQQGSMLPFYLRRWPRPDRLAVGIEVTMRNMNLALLLQATPGLFSQSVADGVLFAVLYFAAVAMIAGFLLALNHVRLWRRERAPQTCPDSSPR
jgi:BASS family bile acid:Na+ symporter